MNKTEFAKISAYLSAGIGKKISVESMDVWFDMLQDLPAEVVLMAVKKVLSSYEYATIPPVGMIRKAAAELMIPQFPLAIEAWNEAIKAVQYYGQYKAAEGLASLSQPVREIVEQFGWKELCVAEKPEIIRAQFTKAWETVVKREQDKSVLPGPVRELLESREVKQLPKGKEDKYKDLYAI